MSTETIKANLLALLDDYKDFNSSPITTQPIPTPVEFAKQVSKGYPAIYRAYDKTADKHGKVQTWTDPSLLECPAFTWTKADLTNLVTEKVEVAVTPNGRADDLHHIDGHSEPVFLSPATVNMTLAELLDKLSNADPKPRTTPSANTTNPTTPTSPIYYLQSQNSNLTTPPLTPLLRHLPAPLPFATPTLGPPDAINLWIGDSNSTTSTHRDPYENLYLVLKGTKIFTLYPPVDEICLPVRHVRTGKYVYDPEEGFSTVLEGEGEGDVGRIPWVDVEPGQERSGGERHGEEGESLYKYASPRTVRVREGEVLYLPGGWYHHVRQECGIWDAEGEAQAGEAPCIAVNYWYDMEYEGEKYVMRQLLGRLVAEMR